MDELKIKKSSIKKKIPNNLFLGSILLCSLVVIFLVYYFFLSINFDDIDNQVFSDIFGSSFSDVVKIEEHLLFPKKNYGLVFGRGISEVRYRDYTILISTSDWERIELDRKIDFIIDDSRALKMFEYSSFSFSNPLILKNKKYIIPILRIPQMGVAKIHAALLITIDKQTGLNKVFITVPNI